MKILGITGGVGAGKSTVLEYLRERYGAKTIQADQVGHLLMAPGQSCYESVIALLGKGILRADKTIDRNKVSAQVFSDSVLLEKLNRIIHPAVKEYINQRISSEREKGTKLLVIEAALFLEEHYDEICDEVWYIDVDEKIRRQRLKAQRGYSDEKITGIMANQMSREEFISRCDAAVENQGDLQMTYRQIDERL